MIFVHSNRIAFTTAAICSNKTRTDSGTANTNTRSALHCEQRNVTVPTPDARPSQR